MNQKRITSLDPVLINNWRWQSFLDKAIHKLINLNVCPCEIPAQFLENQINLGSSNNTKLVNISTWACTTNKIKIARAACLEANKIGSVFNFVITPKEIFDIPFLGADFVALPNGYLIALDLQPALKNDIHHTEKVWQRLIPIYEKWSKMLPTGGPIPKDAQPYFSPGFLWTKIPLGKTGDELIDKFIKPAFDEYLDLFLELLSKAPEVSRERSLVIANGQKEYFKYRSVKDPARTMLNKFYGVEWTEEYINKVLFNLE